MGEKKKIREALVKGARKGLRGEKLYEHVVATVPGVRTSKIVKSAFYCLTDPEITNRQILNVIYDVAIRYRTVPDRET